MSVRKILLALRYLNQKKCKETIYFLEDVIELFYDMQVGNKDHWKSETRIGPEPKPKTVP